MTRIVQGNFVDCNCIRVLQYLEYMLTSESHITSEIMHLFTIPTALHTPSSVVTIDQSGITICWNEALR
jgi:hypothetical protein